MYNQPAPNLSITSPMGPLPRPAPVPSTNQAVLHYSSSMQVITRLLKTSRKGAIREQGTKHAPLWPTPLATFLPLTVLDSNWFGLNCKEWREIPRGVPIVIQLAASFIFRDPIIATVMVNKPGSSSFLSVDPVFDISVLLFRRKSALGTDWLSLASSDYKHGDCVDIDDRGFSYAPVCSTMYRDHPGNGLVIQYSNDNEVFLIISFFKNVFLYPNQLDALQVRYGFRFSGHNFKIRMIDDFRLTSAGGSLASWFRWDGINVVACHCTSPHIDMNFIRILSACNKKLVMSVSCV